MPLPKYFLFLLFWVAAIPSHAQDCTLGIDGPDAQTIVRVFALDSLQQQRLAAYAKSLKAENELLQEKADALLATHPQDSPESLAALGVKYREIKDEMVDNATRYDRMLLGHFTPKQLAVYRQLCQEVLREPLTPILPKNQQEPEN